MAARPKPAMGSPGGGGVSFTLLIDRSTLHIAPFALSITRARPRPHSRIVIKAQENVVVPQHEQKQSELDKDHLTDTDDDDPMLIEVNPC